MIRHFVITSYSIHYTKLYDTMAESCGYLAAIQTRDDRVQLLTSRNHYVFNLAWLKERPSPKSK